MSGVRRIKEGAQTQGVDESIAYTIDTTNWGGSPTSPTMVIKNKAGSDVTSELSTGSPSVDVNVITLPKISGVTSGERYRVEVKFAIGGNTLECWFPLIGEV